MDPFILIVMLLGLWLSLASDLSTINKNLKTIIDNQKTIFDWIQDNLQDK